MNTLAGCYVRTTDGGYSGDAGDDNDGGDPDDAGDGGSVDYANYEIYETEATWSPATLPGFVQCESGLATQVFNSHLCP